MKFFSKGKDGGSESYVTGYWLCEIKRLFSIALLKFDNGSREMYHTHAFNSLSWVISGKLVEYFSDLGWYTNHIRTHYPSWKPIVTRRGDLHKVVSKGTTWVLTFRGPWADRWYEYNNVTGQVIRLTHGRKITA